MTRESLKPICHWARSPYANKALSDKTHRFELYDCTYPMPEIPTKLPVSVPHYFRNILPIEAEMVCRDYCNECPCYEKNRK